MKTLFLLLGPKGAGKTHIGSLVHAHTDIHFLRVEAIWLALAPGEDGWQKVLAAIDALFATRDRVMIESLGVGDGFRGFAAALAQRYTIRRIRVMADPATCLQRVRTRNAAEHLAVADDKVVEYNRLAAAAVHDWDAVIDNEGPADAATILRIVRGLAGSAGA